jgi:hypothetical protein
MTEAQWLQSEDPDAMFAVFDAPPRRSAWQILGFGARKKGKEFQRKLRLYCSACCRRLWNMLDRLSRSAVEELERFADGRISERELEAAYCTACAAHNVVVRSLNDPEARVDDLWDATQAVRLSCTLSCNPRWMSVEVARHVAHAVAYATNSPFETPAWSAAWSAERLQQAKLLRHLLGNPFRATSDPVPPSVNAYAVDRLAESLDAGEDCSFALRDALLECGHVDLAEHFKDQDHPKGCWALDLLLGRS